MKKAAVLVCMASVLLSGCSGAGGEKVSQTADSCAQAVASELAKTDWTAVSTDAQRGRCVCDGAYGLGRARQADRVYTYVRWRAE
ncbi:MAG: hypothetical protein ACLUI6_10020 [Butyricicoccus sp.]